MCVRAFVFLVVVVEVFCFCCCYCSTCHTFAHCWCVGYLSLTDSKSIKCNTATRPISVLLNLLLFGFRCEASDSKNGTNERIKNLSVCRLCMCMCVRTRETKQNEEKKSKIKLKKQKWKLTTKTASTLTKTTTQHSAMRFVCVCVWIQWCSNTKTDTKMCLRCFNIISFYGMYRYIV